MREAKYPNPHRGFSTLLALFAGLTLLLTLTLSLTALLAPRRQQSPQIASQPQTSSTTREAILTHEWMTYVDEVYNYSIKYPSNWHIIPTPKEGIGGSAIFENYDSNKVSNPGDLTSSSTDKIKVEIGVFLREKPPTQSLQEWLKITDIEKPPPTYTKILSEETWQVAGKLAIRRIVDKAIVTAVTLYVPRGNKVYYLTAMPANSKHIDKFYTMVNTFQFIQ